MSLAIYAVLFLMLAVVGCLSLLVGLLALVLITSAVTKPVVASVAPLDGPARSETATATDKNNYEASERVHGANMRAITAAAAPSATSAAMISSHRIADLDLAVTASGSTKETDIDTGINYGNDHFDSARVIDVDAGVNDAVTPEHDDSICSSLNDSSPNLDKGEDMSSSPFTFDEDDSFFLSSEVGSQFLQSGDLDVDWELESIASVHSSINDTDYMLGGESLDSDEEEDEDEGSDSDEDLYLRGWSSDLESVCSSLNDTDYMLGGESYDSDAESECASAVDTASECSSLNDADYILGGEPYDSDSECESESGAEVCAVTPIDVDMVEQDVAPVCASKLDEDDDESTEDETDEENEVETEQPVVSASNSLCSERVTRAILAGFVGTARGPTRTLAVVPAKPTNATPTASVSSTERVAAAEPVVPVVRSRVYDFNTSPRFLAQREANLARTQAIRQKSALTKASLFH